MKCSSNGGCQRFKLFFSLMFKNIKKSSKLQCVFCQGKGIQPGTEHWLCIVCKGRGRVTIQQPYDMCKECGGTGKKENTNLYCLLCHGKGFISEPFGLISKFSTGILAADLEKPRRQSRLGFEKSQHSSIAKFLVSKITRKKKIKKRKNKFSKKKRARQSIKKSIEEKENKKLILKLSSRGGGQHNPAAKGLVKKSKAIAQKIKEKKKSFFNRIRVIASKIKLP